jgi:hypothetical protein
MIQAEKTIDVAPTPSDRVLWLALEFALYSLYLLLSRSNVDEQWPKFLLSLFSSLHYVSV